jgi:hypothetical protein
VTDGIESGTAKEGFFEADIGAYGLENTNRLLGYFGTDAITSQHRYPMRHGFAV